MSNVLELEIKIKEIPHPGSYRDIYEKRKYKPIDFRMNRIDQIPDDTVAEIEVEQYKLITVASEFSKQMQTFGVKMEDIKIFNDLLGITNAGIEKMRREAKQQGIEQERSRIAKKLSVLLNL